MLSFGVSPDMRLIRKRVPRPSQEPAAETLVARVHEPRGGAPAIAATQIEVVEDDSSGSSSPSGSPVTPVAIVEVIGSNKTAPPPPPPASIIVAILSGQLDATQANVGYALPASADEIAQPPVFNQLLSECLLLLRLDYPIFALRRLVPEVGPRTRTTTTCPCPSHGPYLAAPLTTRATARTQLTVFKLLEDSGRPSLRGSTDARVCELLRIERQMYPTLETMLDGASWNLFSSVKHLQVKTYLRSACHTRTVKADMAMTGHARAVHVA